MFRNLCVFALFWGYFLPPITPWSFAHDFAIHRRANEFADYQQKIMKIDDHIAIAVSGLTADARALASYKLSALYPIPA